MNDLPKLYFTMETYLFPLLEEELCELTAKMKEFLRIVEMIKNLSLNNSKFSINYNVSAQPAPW